MQRIAQSYGGGGLALPGGGGRDGRCLLYTSVSVARKLGQPVEQVYKTLVTKGRGGHFVFVIPVAAELDLKAAARAVDEKAVELIPVKDINKVTGYIRGGCSPVGMKKLFPTVLDLSLIHISPRPRSGGSHRTCRCRRS